MENNTELPPLVHSAANNNKARIRINHEYGVGLVFITENLNILINFFRARMIDKQTLIDSNTVTIVTSSCNPETFKLSEFFVKTSWFSFMVSHLIVLLNDCSKLTFYDVLANKIAWIDIDNTSLNIEELITFNTFNYMQYPIRISMFPRFPTVMDKTELAGVYLPSYIPKMYNYTKDQTGFDAILFASLVERLNFKGVFFNLNRSYYGGFDTKTQQFTGTLGDIINNRSDIALNSRYVKSYGADDKTEFLSSSGFDKICVITPKAQLIPKWKAPLLIFEPFSWLGLALLNVASGIFWIFFQKFKTRYYRCL